MIREQNIGLPASVAASGSNKKTTYEVDWPGGEEQQMKGIAAMVLALALAVAILDDGSGDGGPPDPQPPVIGTDV